MILCIKYIGKYNLLFQIPQILYSALISRFIDSLIKNFSLSQDIFVELKQEKRTNNLEQKRKKLFSILKIKFILYFLLTFIVVVFFLYYITCFCGIYVNTQIHLIKDSLLSLALGLLYPFGMYLIPGVFRISALRAEKQNRKCMYKFSSFVESYLC